GFPVRVCAPGQGVGCKGAPYWFANTSGSWVVGNGSGAMRGGGVGSLAGETKNPGPNPGAGVKVRPRVVLPAWAGPPRAERVGEPAGHHIRQYRGPRSGPHRCRKKVYSCGAH